MISECEGLILIWKNLHGIQLEGLIYFKTSTLQVFAKKFLVDSIWIIPLLPNKIQQ